MQERAGLAAGMKGARCSDIPGEASWTASHVAPGIGANSASVKNRVDAPPVFM